jgi:hypothetical protein
MKITKQLFALLFAVFLFSAASVQADDLNTKKMEQVTKDILESFVKQNNTSEILRKYISEEWLDKKKLNVKKYKINNYSPEQYEILYSGGDICVATIGGSSWSHLVIFKFTDEYGAYKVIPKGISEASADYIDPWYTVKDYICPDKSEEPEEPKEENK